VSEKRVRPVCPPGGAGAFGMKKAPAPVVSSVNDYCQ